MAYKKALTEGEVKSANLKSVRAWIKANASKIKADPNKTLLYSGRDFDLETLKDATGKAIPDEDRDTFMGTPMWKRIERIKARRAKQKIPASFQTINDVLETLKSPIIIDKDQQDKGFTTAFECFMELKNCPDIFPKPEVEKIWSILSDTFAANAEGNIAILDGAADDYTKLKGDKDFITKELPRLMKNKDLSEQGKKVLKKMISKYGSHFDRRYTDLMKNIDDGKATLTKKLAK